MARKRKQGEESAFSKLTPAQHPANDLLQVCVYGLMHHVQHQTGPDVGVLYLHPARQMVEKPWEGWRLQLELKPEARSGDVVARLVGAVVELGAFRLGSTVIALLPPGAGTFSVAVGDRVRCGERIGAAPIGGAA